MKTIKPEELFANVQSFLESKGVELKDGSYTNRVRQGCHVLTKVVNGTQTGLAKAKAEIDGQLERVRQVIHEKTAPKTPADPAVPPKPSASDSPAAAAKTPKKPVRRSAPAKPVPSRKARKTA